MEVPLRRQALRTAGWLLIHLVYLSWTAGAEAQTIRYVSAAGSSTPPFDSWSTAATNIQDAIDAATTGDMVLVTNGLYATGGRVVYGSLTNRVAVTKPIMVSSVNGQQVTTIQGYQMPGTTNGDGAVRCAYLTNGASLIGFTLTNGATRTAGNTLQENFGGGVWCESTNALVAQCAMVRNSAGAHGGGAYSGTLQSCILTGNSAAPTGYGGGAYNSRLENCALNLNSANYGAGAAGGMLIGCGLATNSAWAAGGGAWNATLTNCVLTGNSSVLQGGGCNSCSLSACTLALNSSQAGGGVGGGTLTGCVLSNNTVIVNGNGGGAYNATLDRCTLVGNSAGAGGGGSYGGTLNNCVLTANSARNGHGGGANQGTLNNCTLTGNWAEVSGGGSYSSTLNNCIVWFNTAPQFPNYSNAKLVRFSCTTPDPAGNGNIATDPLLASVSHLSAGSPCKGAGSAAYTSGLDIDGEPWSNPPSIGADEHHPGSVTGPLAVSIEAAWTNGAVGSALPFLARIDGRTTSSRWTFEDGSVVSNQPYATHVWIAPGTNPIVLTAFNDDHPSGVSSAVTVRIAASIDLYVAASATNPVPPYNSWNTAASNIQAAVDVAAQFSGATVWVTNGIYATGGRAVFGAMTNRVAVTTPLTLRSVNGPAGTIISGQQAPGTMTGDGAVRCVYLTNGASLIGFTLTNGASLSTQANDQDHEASGGGVWAGMIGTTISNCVLCGNAAYRGGGDYGGTLTHCILSRNWATAIGVVASGGGAANATLDHCSLTGNVGGDSGAAIFSTLTDCIVTGNAANSIYGSGGGGVGVCTLNNCTIVSNSSASYGGGTYSSTVYNCLLSDNSAVARGGGAYLGSLSNCTIVGNSSTDAGGGSYSAGAKNCIIYYNSAPNGSNYFGGALSFCCTAPAGAGVGNITNSPSFVDYATRNLRLSSNSACIDGGNNPFVIGTVDLDDRPRIVGSAVDLGAYEFQEGSTNNYLAWLVQYGLSPDISSDGEDSDGDGMSNWQEWLADTCPTNSSSVFRVSSAGKTSPSGPISISFTSSIDRLYTLFRSTDLSDGSWVSVPGETDVPGAGGWQALTDTNAAAAATYRVRVRTR